MTPGDNIIYFNMSSPGPKYDIRLCPKNACTTMKGVYVLTHFDKDKLVEQKVNFDRLGLGTIYRTKKIREYASPIDPPFRKGSIRVAIKRNPVKRFQSACAYLYKQSMLGDKPKDTLLKGKVDVGTTIDDVLLQIENGTINDTHFFSQNYYMGNSRDYDLLIDISDLPQFLNKLESEVEPKSSFKHLWVNDTKDVHSYNILSERQIDLVRDLYKQDYKYGWY